jgi:peptidoglycan hydrolase-like protein with peptidoglycan-binding domain
VSLSLHFGSTGYHHDRQVPAHSGRIIADVQRQLNRRGYQAGIVDGVLGPRTRHAIRAFQVDRRLPVTGTINEAVLFHLGLI